MRRRPLGVTAVARLTLIMALALFCFQIFLFAFVSIGGPPPPAERVGLPLTFFIPSFLAVFALSVSIGQLLGAEWAWYASVFFWIIEIVFFGYFTYGYVLDLGYVVFRLDLYSYVDVLYAAAGLLLILSPIVYGVGCLAYFLKKTTRAYFDVSI